MEYTESKSNGIVVLKLFGNLDMLNAGILKERIKESASQSEHRFIFDLEGVSFIDSSGFGLIMSLNDKLTELGGGLRIVNVSKTIRQIFRISKISSVIQIFESTEEAIQSFLP
ncbi:anti-sigma factor antagonist [Leptospira biflexa]|jgi:anti-sigma B factor antagonist|uniref:Anti-sigma factor antagonist n=1 Tax=Leptospira biflexa serovar Patoc (strain Patoc 1 / ATCC 23582 / Paris) TaxID=456481 RepID=B0SJ84_LEPBP|nr:STAS domain-containing protein [Leptospira biflexa]ABZ93015.1 Anti-sigma factor antagonist [Leptospira biflexa serovar Patoc strain 'Patoc 1 (Ames)']ABZ96634.1 Putative anti-sigma-B factor antagonist (Anti-anti-sigma-B factor) [Leptospira biflexa serovar Patoc strain 'Patoc 1 (Paris)']TGM37923.1 anti-sigma factor antagonist [Leptospira biflexa]TGM41254.1 anti-sigma factor antagonist [Leptospira biflexa]TGM47456.1 anti-sigma factor antagonist [Leptospira biflexa]